MPAKRAKSRETAEHFGLPITFLKNGARSGLLTGCFFRIGSRGDYLWDFELLELKLKELTTANKENKSNFEYGKLRRIEV
ncbi:hypothetical protein RBH29_08580 [Herbivorax sp. ANBcel31]|uniref:hypothetical protein n=1 Tax=Herbivorax sp. ANBcel31 TaxID=3069754 RepID=UPI0027B3EA3B|nr:hypothetical protein [Herbivorax sp. ANBcel31]MDQ2086481.1 hypothetical protein [Herbivorax sp. ANBcel31]